MLYFLILIIIFLIYVLITNDIVVVSKYNIVSNKIPKDFDMTLAFSIEDINTYQIENKKFLYYDTKLKNTRDWIRGIYPLSKFQNEISKIWDIGIYLSPWLFIFVVIFGYRIIKNAFKPVKKISETALLIKKSKNFSRRIELDNSEDEIHKMASTFNERLLLDYMLENTNDPKERIALLEQEIGNIVGTFYFQALLADYEYQAHKLAEAGEPITAEVLSKIMEDLFDKYYGDIIEKDDLIYIFWARVPHFFNSPFYVYQYATCFASSAILYEKIINSSDESKRKETLDKYIQLLSSGGNDFPMEQLKKAGVDLSKIETIEAVARQFDLLLDKLEAEIGKL